MMVIFQVQRYIELPNLQNYSFKKNCKSSTCLIYRTFPYQKRAKNEAARCCRPPQCYFFIPAMRDETGCVT